MHRRKMDRATQDKLNLDSVCSVGYGYVFALKKKADGRRNMILKLE